jgi:hypothetical protein
VPEKETSLIKLALVWLARLPLASKLLVFFGCLFLLSGLFGLLPPRPIFSVRLICLGLSWDYFFRIKIMGIHTEEYPDDVVKKQIWVQWSKLIGGFFFLALVAMPNQYWMWIYHRLS